MSKLEPTRTYSNPTATDVVRRMLDERGVEYTEDRGYREFFWDFGESGRARASAIGTKGLVQMIVTGITSEQAIAATVGSDKVEAVLRKLIARLGVAADFHFARKYVDCIVEEYAGKLATLGRGTCREVMINRHWRGCSECGYVWENMYGEGFQKGPNYCPICGRRIEQ